jgi:hypothetical protein
MVSPVSKPASASNHQRRDVRLSPGPSPSGSHAQGPGLAVQAERAGPGARGAVAGACTRDDEAAVCPLRRPRTTAPKTRARGTVSRCIRAGFVLRCLESDRPSGGGVMLTSRQSRVNRLNTSIEGLLTYRSISRGLQVLPGGCAGLPCRDLAPERHPPRQHLLPLLLPGTNSPIGRDCFSSLNASVTMEVEGGQLIL